MGLVRIAVWTLVVGLTRPGFGAELIHLQSGFDLEATSHTISGSTYSLETQTGTIEIPKADVTGIESLPDSPAPRQSSNAEFANLPSLIHSVAMSEAGTPEFSRLVQCVAEVESAMRRDARSSKGAIGVMQLMPDTAKALGVVAADTTDNVRGGAKYLRELLVQYRCDAVLALAAYNAGPGAVKKYGGVPPFAETRLYIEKVLGEYSKLQRASSATKQ